MLPDQWKQLIVRLCEEMSASLGTLEPPPRWVVVIDALDEYHDERKVDFVLQLISETPGITVPQLLIFLTSWPHLLIRRSFAALSASLWRHIILHLIDPLIVDQDIMLHF
jgi:hypothetical protein